MTTTQRKFIRYTPSSSGNFAKPAAQPKKLALLTQITPSWSSRQPETARRQHRLLAALMTALPSAFSRLLLLLCHAAAVVADQSVIIERMYSGGACSSANLYEEATFPAGRCIAATAAYRTAWGYGRSMGSVRLPRRHTAAVLCGEHASGVRPGGTPRDQLRHGCQHRWQRRNERPILLHASRLDWEY